jgi:hypothetical protein
MQEVLTDVCVEGYVDGEGLQKKMSELSLFLSAIHYAYKVTVLQTHSGVLKLKKKK